MIHSMSGGVLSEPVCADFVKVKFDGGDVPYWFITELEVSEGDRVMAPLGADGVGKPATVIRLERAVSSQVSPIPFKRAKKIISKL